MSETDTSTPDGMHHPYRDSRYNFLYNLLFCDEPSLFSRGKESNDGPWPILFADVPDPLALRALAHDETGESRLRALAFRRLRDLGHEVTPRILLGVIVEVPLEMGLDTLAAYGDGRVRYLNQGGKVVIIDGENTAQVDDLTRLINDAAQRIVNAIGPIDGARKPPPTPGNVRLTFIVSDGIYTGEGPFTAFRRDPLGGPVLAGAEQLLQRVIGLATNHQPDGPVNR